jgi:hypothetical protein
MLSGTVLQLPAPINFSQKHNRECASRNSEGNTLLFLERPNRPALGRKVWIRDCLSFVEKHKTAEALYLARRPREAVPRGGMIGLNPGNEPGRSPSALDFNNEKIKARRSRDEN